MIKLRSKVHTTARDLRNPEFPYVHSRQTRIQDSAAWKAAIAARDQVKVPINVRELKRRTK